MKQKNELGIDAMICSTKKNNKKNKRLTIAELRTLKGFENQTDVELDEVIRSLTVMAEIFIDIYLKQKSKSKITNEILNSDY